MAHRRCRSTRVGAYPRRTSRGLAGSMQFTCYNCARFRLTEHSHDSPPVLFARRASDHAGRRQRAGPQRRSGLPGHRPTGRRLLPRQRHAEEKKNCLDSEQAIRDQLAKEWSSFAPRQDRLHQRSQDGRQSSYTELLTCLEMARDVRDLQSGADTPAPNRPRRCPRIAHPLPQRLSLRSLRSQCRPQCLRRHRPLSRTNSSELIILPAALIADQNFADRRLGRAHGGVGGTVILDRPYGADGVRRGFRVGASCSDRICSRRGRLASAAAIPVAHCCHAVLVETFDLNGLWLSFSSCARSRPSACRPARSRSICR